MFWLHIRIQPLYGSSSIIIDIQKPISLYLMIQWENIFFIIFGTHTTVCLVSLIFIRSNRFSVLYIFVSQRLSKTVFKSKWTKVKMKEHERYKDKISLSHHKVTKIPCIFSINNFRYSPRPQTNCTYGN